MKVKINKDGEEKVIEMIIKGRDVNEVWKQLKQLQENDEDMNAVIAYKDFLDNKVSELSGLTLEELDDLEIDEKNKLTGMLVQKAKDTLNFTPPSTK